MGNSNFQILTEAASLYYMTSTFVNYEKGKLSDLKLYNASEQQSSTIVLEAGNLL